MVTPHFGENDYAAIAGEFDGGSQTGDAASEDDVIGW